MLPHPQPKAPAGSSTAGLASRMAKIRSAAASCSDMPRAAAGRGWTASKAAMTTRQMTARPTPVNRPSPTMGIASTSTSQTVAWVAKVTPAVPSASNPGRRVRGAPTMSYESSWTTPFLVFTTAEDEQIRHALDPIRNRRRQIGPNRDEAHPGGRAQPDHRDGDHHRG